jgi:hypothetical protein
VVGFVLYTFLNVFYYWRVGVHVKDTAARHSGPSSEAI